MQTLLTQLVYFGFFQSILLLVIYLTSPRNRKRINGFLAFLIFILFIGLTGKVLHSVGVWGSNFRLISLSELSALLFGPTIYLFVKTIFKKHVFTSRDILHYVPGMLYSAFIAVYFIIPSDEVLRGKISTGELHRVVSICHAVGLVVNISYWVAAFRFFRNFSNELNDELSYKLHTRFISNFIVITGMGLLLWTILYLISLFGFTMLERDARPYIWIAFSLVILFITYFGMISPKVLQIVPEELVIKKYAKSKLTSEDMERLKADLNNLMLEKKPYLNSKLLKTELAEMLGVNSPELARLLNENIGMNFFEYVNYYRIKEFITIAQSEKGKQLTFFAIAQEAGFNSKTTFNKSFKKLIGSSPSTYFNKKI